MVPLLHPAGLKVAARPVTVAWHKPGAVLVATLPGQLTVGAGCTVTVTVVAVPTHPEVPGPIGVKVYTTFWAVRLLLVS